MKFYQYKSETDIHRMDTSGNIDLSEGLRRLRLLNTEFQKYNCTNFPIKVLVDTRKYSQYSTVSHVALTNIARNQFITRFNLITAIVNNDFNYLNGTKEGWFTNEQDALDWLSSN